MAVATAEDVSALLDRITKLERAATWRPIESAPKGVWAERIDDPTYVAPPEVQLLFEGGRQCVGKWDWYYADGGEGAWETNGIGWIEALTLEPVIRHLSAPTHWMPVPANGPA